MELEILHRPGNSAAKITLQENETVTTEAGAMIAASDNLRIETSTHQRGGSGGLLAAAKRLLSGESFFLNHYTALGSAGEIYLATPLPGDMMQYDLQGENLIVQAGSFVACSDGVKVNLGWQGFKNLISGESMFWLNLSGTGRTVLSSFGAIYPIEIDGEYIVDTGHIVAFNETLNFTVTKAGKSWIGAILGGEGLVCKFHGRGTVWCQSHNPPSFGQVFGPMLKPRG
jgi:uncharacterized protein (TIGR00266 family)